MNTKRVLYVLLAVALVALSYGIYAAIANTGNLVVGMHPIDINDIPIDVDFENNYLTNVDLKNTGDVGAYDLAVVLSGKHRIPGTYDGYTSSSSSKAGWFDPPTVSYNVTKKQTTIHWQGFHDFDDNIINPNQTIHVGWRFEGSLSDIVDMYWTDINGNKIAGSKVYLVDTGVTYYTLSGKIGITWRNAYEIDSPLTISEAYYAYVPAEIPLEELNAENDTLNRLLQPVPGGELIIIPHYYQYTLELPAGGAIGSTVVLRYKVTGNEADADLVNYYQTTIQ